jgi:hypothetical protein
MLNPSTADAEVEDPTIRRCIGYSHAWGFAGIVVINLFVFSMLANRGARPAHPTCLMSGIPCRAHVRMTDCDDG